MFKKTSEAGIAFIKKAEGFREKPYFDVTGMCIGYGTHIATDLLTKVTKEEADKLLRDYLTSIVEPYLNKYITVPLSQEQVDALASFVYNVGVGAFLQSTLLKKVLAGDLHAAAYEFLRWKYKTVKGEKVEDKGLLSRRTQEHTMFLSGVTNLVK